MNSYPLSNAQKGVWLTQRKYENSSLFNIGGTVTIAGNINITALRQAISNIILQNSALNLRLIEKDNNIYQYISDNICVVNFIDFSIEDNPREVFEQWSDQQARTPFKMVDSPLYYFCIFKVTDNNMGYFIKLHHIIADGWSIQLLTNQITKEYESIIELSDGNTKVSTVAERPSYIRHIQNEESEIKKMDKAKNYWSRMYSPMPILSPVCCKDLSGKRLSFIPNDIIQNKIEQYIHKYNISVNTFLIFLYILYAYKKFGIKDIIVGIPLLGRIGKAERQIFGTFSNTMPYRYIIDPKEELKEVIKTISADMKNNMRFQKYPYNLLYNELKLNERGVGRIYNACINYYNTSISTTFGGLKAENKEFYNGEQDYALQIIIRHWNNIRLQLDIDFQTCLYSESQITCMYQELVILMNQVFSDDSIKMEDIVLINDKEKNRIINTLNNTAKAYPKEDTWLSIFREVVLQEPMNVAVSHNNKSISYQELDRLSNRIANKIVSMGIKSGSIIAVVPEYDIQSIAVIIAIMKCCGIYLPLDINCPTGRIDELLNKSEAALFIAKENLVTFSGKFLSFKELTAEHNDEGIISHCKPSDTAYIIYTSGSSGSPKGVMVTHKNLMNYLCWAKDYYIVLDKEVFALYSSFSFDFTLTSVFLPLVSGNEIRIYNHTTEVNIFKDILDENRVTILKITPSHITLINDVISRNSSIHTFIIGGEKLKTKVCEQLSAKFDDSVTIYNEYGPTEATIGCMVYQYNNDASDTIPIGKPISNTTIYLLDQDRQPVPDDTLGEIYIGGDSVSKGYYQSSEDTILRFSKSPFKKNEILYKTGDWAYRDGADNIYFYGRIDQEVNIRGNRIHISEIESKVLSSGMVRDVYVKAIQVKDKSLQLCAYIVPKELFELNRLKDYLENHLPGYMIPYYYSILDSFPLSSNGKINDICLPTPITSSKFYSCNKLLIEHEILLNAVKTIVGEDIALEDNFYTFGGDSIKAIQLSSQLSKLGFELSVRNILSHPVIYDMTQHMKPKVGVRYEQGTCSGNIMKTPIISWFFNQNFEELGHYNQSVLLELYQMISKETLSEVLSEIVRHHDILRLNYDKGNDRLFYNNKHLESDILIHVINLNRGSMSYITDVINGQLNHTFDLENSLLIKPYLLLYQNRRYLYLTAHHLVIDGVSWRILLEDIIELLKQIASRQEMKLPDKTISYGRYAELYNEWASINSLDLDYWSTMLRFANQLPTHNTYHSVYGDTVSAEIRLNYNMTKSLLGSANDTYHTKANELLLIALAQAVNQVFL